MTEPNQLPPHSDDDERGVLSCVLQDADLCLPDCSRLKPESFYVQHNQIVWRAICALNSANSTVNVLSVGRYLEQHEKIDGVRSLIASMAEFSPSPSNLSYYLPSVMELDLKRRMIRGCAKLSDASMNGHTAPQIMAMAESLLSTESHAFATVRDGATSSARALSDIERRHANQGQLPGLDTGLSDLNAMIDGLQYGEQTLIGARPSAGKTALGLGIFAHCVFTLKLPALFVSLEMSDTALMRRMMAMDTKISMSTIRRGTYSEGDFPKFTSFLSKAKKSPLFILDGVGGLGIGEICSQVRRHVRKNNIRLVVIDFLQKIRPDQRHEKRTYEVGAVSTALKGLAVDTGAAFLTLAQLNRDSDKEKPRSPKLTDLADSSQIERDADTVILIDRPQGSMDARLIIAKQRDGETGCVRAVFVGNLCRFENASKFQDDDLPPTHYPND